MPAPLQTFQSDPRLSALRQPASPPSDPRAAKAARDFEAMALGALLQPMFAGLGSGGAFGGGSAEAMWRPMLVNEIARALADAGGLGIGDLVMRQMAMIREPSR